MADEACEVRPAGNRERAFTRIDPNCNLLTQNILIILHDVIVVNNNLSILIRNDISYWLISTYHQNCEDRLLVKSSWYHRLYTFSSLPNCIIFFFFGDQRPQLNTKITPLSSAFPFTTIYPEITLAFEICYHK